MTTFVRARDWVLALFDEDDPAEPGYDPVHLGASVVVTLAAMGCLYWLLWTLLVFEGGIFLKAAALAKLLFTSTTLADLGYEGSYAKGSFEGWFGNALALAFTIALLVSLKRLYRDAARRNRPSK